MNINIVKAVRTNFSLETLILMMGAFGFLAIIFNSYHGGFDSALFGNLTLLSLAFTMVGLLLGVLFGIPKSKSNQMQNENADKKPPITANTNLEDVSDWLTKILIGLGLAEISGISESITHLIDNINEMMPSISKVTVLGTSLYFPIYGFLTGWLLARIPLTEKLKKEALGESLNNANEEIMKIAKSVIDNAVFDPNQPSILNELGSNEANIVAKVQLLEENREKIEGTVYHKLGMIVLIAKNYGIAAKYFRKSYDLTHDPKSLMNIGTIYSEFKRYKEAIEIYDRILAEHKNHPQALYNLACALSESKELDKAIQALESAIKYGDARYPDVAKKDSSFINLASDERFQKLVPDYKPTNNSHFG